MAERRQSVTLSPWTLDGDPNERTRGAVRREADRMLNVQPAWRRATSAGTVGGPTQTVALSAHRFAAGTGTTMLSSGIPLPAGYLSPSTANVRLLKNGTEVACYVELLNGRHTDGSVRSVLVQYDNGTMTNGTPDATFSLSIGVPSTVARVAKDTTAIDPWTSHGGALLPSSADYLVQTNCWLGTGLLTDANTPSTPTWLDTAESLFESKGDQIWGIWGDQANRGIAEYDHVVLHLQKWAKSGDSKWFDRAYQMGHQYWNHFANHTSYDTEIGSYPWLCNARSLASYYLISGDTRALDYMAVMANGQVQDLRGPVWDTPDNSYWMGGALGDDRMRARGLQTVIFADLLSVATTPDGLYAPKYSHRGIPGEYLEDLLGTVSLTRGMWGGTYYSKTSAGDGGCWVTAGGQAYRCHTSHTADSATEPGVGADWATVWDAIDMPSTFTHLGTWVNGRTYYPGYKPYMVGMLMMALIQYYELVDADARIPGLLKATCDDLMARAWVPASNGFKYVTVADTNAENDGDSPQPLLNGMMLAAFGWVYKYYGTATYKTYGDSIAEYCTTGSADWHGFPMQFDESYQTWHEYVYHRN